MKRSRPTPEFLRKLRTRRIAVVHPRDEDGEILMQQLQRIGCTVQARWPHPPDPDEEFDVIFGAVAPGALSADADWLRKRQSAAVIAIVGYESPTVFDEVLRLGALGVLTTPIRPTGVLAVLVMALSLHDELSQLHRRVARLEQKLSSVNEINDAKAIMMRTRGVDDREAYRIIREQAMSKRVPTEEIARAIIHANAILSA